MKSFLVVDDDPGITSLYEILIKIRYSDASVLQAHNGREALRKALTSDCSLIISDIDMPIMKGIDFHKALKRKSSALSKRMAFISSRCTLPYVKNEGLPCLTKPFNKKDFYSLIDALLTRKTPGKKVVA